MVDCPSRYNALLGRQWIHAMKAVPSTFHQMIKFLVGSRIGQICGEPRGIPPPLMIEEVDAEMDPEEHDIELRHNPANDPKKRPREVPDIRTGKETRCEKWHTLGLGNSTCRDSNISSMTSLPKGREKRFIMNLTSPVSSKELHHFLGKVGSYNKNVPCWPKNCYLSNMSLLAKKRALKKNSYWLKCRATS